MFINVLKYIQEMIPIIQLKTTNDPNLSPNSQHATCLLDDLHTHWIFHDTCEISWWHTIWLITFILLQFINTNSREFVTWV